MSEIFNPSELAFVGETPKKSSVVESENKKSLEINFGSNSATSGESLSPNTSPTISSGQQIKDSRFLLKCLPKLAAFFGKGNKHVEVSRIESKQISVVEVLVKRARIQELAEASPLGALQIGIERINIEAKDSTSFKESLSKRIFSKGGASSEQVAVLWEHSLERKVVAEIYAAISLSSEVGRPITFRDAFNRVYESKLAEDRAPLDRIAKALILGR